MDPPTTHPASSQTANGGMPRVTTHKVALLRDTCWGPRRHLRFAEAEAEGALITRRPDPLSADIGRSDC